MRDVLQSSVLPSPVRVVCSRSNKSQKASRAVKFEASAEMYGAVRCSRYEEFIVERFGMGRARA